jgi:hypothetical protein
LNVHSVDRWLRSSKVSYLIPKISAFDKELKRSRTVEPEDEFNKIGNL